MSNIRPEMVLADLEAGMNFNAQQVDESKKVMLIKILSKKKLPMGFTFEYAWRRQDGEYSAIKNILISVFINTNTEIMKGKHQFTFWESRQEFIPAPGLPPQAYKAGKASCKLYKLLCDLVEQYAPKFRQEDKQFPQLLQPGIAKEFDTQDGEHKVLDEASYRIKVYEDKESRAASAAAGAPVAAKTAVPKTSDKKEDDKPGGTVVRVGKDPTPRRYNAKFGLEYFKMKNLVKAICNFSTTVAQGKGYTMFKPTNLTVYPSENTDDGTGLTTEEDKQVERAMEEVKRQAALTTAAAAAAAASAAPIPKTTNTVVQSDISTASAASTTASESDGDEEEDE